MAHQRAEKQNVPLLVVLWMLHKALFSCNMTTADSLRDLFDMTSLVTAKHPFLMATVVDPVMKSMSHCRNDTHAAGDGHSLMIMIQRCVIVPVPDAYHCLLWPNGWMDQDATWYRGRPQARRHCSGWWLELPTAGRCSCCLCCWCRASLHCPWRFPERPVTAVYSLLPSHDESTVAVHIFATMSRMVGLSDPTPACPHWRGATNFIADASEPSWLVISLWPCNTTCKQSWGQKTQPQDHPTVRS